MNPFKIGILLSLVAFFGTGLAFAGKPALKEAQVIELANAAATAKGVRFADYEPPKAHYEQRRKDDTWSVYYQGKPLKPGGFFVIRIHDKTKETTFVPGA